MRITHYARPHEPLGLNNAAARHSDLAKHLYARGELPTDDKIFFLVQNSPVLPVPYSGQLPGAT